MLFIPPPPISLSEFRRHTERFRKVHGRDPLVHEVLEADPRFVQWQRDREADFNARKRERPVTLLLGAVVIAVAVGAALLFAAIAAIARSY